MSEAAAISVRNLVKRFAAKGATVLDGVAFDVMAGEFVAVAGPSGSGKSTLLHLLAALDKPTSGEIVIAGTDLTAHRRPLAHHRREHVGLVFQLHNLLAHLTVTQNVIVAMYGVQRLPAARRRRAEELLRAVGIEQLGDRKPPELSGGERQRVAIARALANDPPIVLADEPTGSLDEVNAGVVIDLLRALAQRGHTVLAATHDLKLLAAADRTLHLVDGRIEAAMPEHA